MKASTHLDHNVYQDLDDYFRFADNTPRTSSLRFPEPRLRRYRRSSRAPLGRRMGCFF